MLGVVKPVDRYGRIARIILKERMGGSFERILLMVMGRWCRSLLKWSESSRKSIEAKLAMEML